MLSRQAWIASSSTQKVMLPRRTSALLYAGQLRTRYRKMKSDLRMPGVYGARQEVVQQRPDSGIPSATIRLSSWLFTRVST